MPELIPLHRVTSPHKKYKAACTLCSASKVKCPGGGPPCKRCVDTHKSLPCHYSLAARTGKPLGSKNKKTLERMHRTNSRKLEDDRAGSAEGEWCSLQSYHSRSPDNGASAVQERYPQDIDSSDEIQMPHISEVQSVSPPLSHPNVVDLFQCIPGQAHTQLTNSTPNIFESDMDKLCNNSGLSDINAADIVISDFWDFESASSRIVWPDVLEGSGSISSPASSQQQSTGPIDNGSPLSSHFLFSDSNKPVSFDAVLARLEATAEDVVSNCREPFSRQSILCQCLRKYTDVLCQLQTIEMRQHPVKADTLLTCTDLVLGTTESQLRCPQCMYDSRVLMQLVMIIQTIFSWIEGQCQPSLGSCMDMKAALGQHNLTAEESTFVKMALVSRAVGRIHMVLRAMVSRVEQMSLSRQKKPSRDGMEADIKNLQHSINALVHASIKLSKSFASRRLKTIQ